MSNVPRPPREPEWIGADNMREDVSHVSDRKLILRGVHEALCTRQVVELWSKQHEKLETRVGQIALHLLDVDRRVVVLEKKPDNDDDRDKEPSIHDFDPELAALRLDMRNKVVDPHHPISEASALALIRAERKRVETLTQAGKWQAVVRFFATGIGQAVSWGWKAAVFGAAGWLLHYLASR